MTLTGVTNTQYKLVCSLIKSTDDILKEWVEPCQGAKRALRIDLKTFEKKWKSYHRQAAREAAEVEEEPVEELEKEQEPEDDDVVLIEVPDEDATDDEWPDEEEEEGADQTPKSTQGETNDIDAPTSSTYVSAGKGKDGSAKGKGKKGKGVIQKGKDGKGKGKDGFKGKGKDGNGKDGKGKDGKGKGKDAKGKGKDAKGKGKDAKGKGKGFEKGKGKGPTSTTETWSRQHSSDDATAPPRKKQKWAEEEQQRFTGVVKNFNSTRGYYFIDCVEINQVYECDPVLFQQDCPNAKTGDTIEFSAVEAEGYRNPVANYARVVRA